MRTPTRWRALRASQRRHPRRRLEVERLEDRLVLSPAPFTLGGDAVVDPADFRSTTFASGLNNPFSMQTLADGSLLVGTSTGSSFGSAGQLLRLVDADEDGVADDGGTVLFTNLAPRVTSVRLAGELVFVNSAGSAITVLRQGATPATPYTLVGSINFTYPSGFEHVTHTLAVRPTPDQPGKYDVFFNLGAATNADETTALIPISGLLTGNLAGDAIHMFTVDDTGPSPVFSNLTQIATGVRNPGGLAFHPVTGDLYFSENGIDGLIDRNEPLSADELNIIAAADIGGAIEDFGFPDNYIEYRTGNEIGSGGIDPLYAFQPLPDPLGGADLESEGPVEIAFAPTSFPAGLNNGVFVTFHGKGSVGTANEENPLVFASLAESHYFHIISNQEPAVGPMDTILATADSIFVADFRGSGAGAIYQIQVVAEPEPGNEPPQVVAPIADLTVPENSPPVLNYADLNAVFDDPDNADSELVYSITANTPSGIVTATIQPDDTLDLSFVTDAFGDVTITVRATDPGSLFAEDTFQVTVTPVNSAPRVANPIADLTVPQDSPPVLDYVNLNTVFDDPDNADSQLVYSITLNAPPGIVAVTIGADDKLDLSFLSGASGVVNLTVRATDPGLLFAEDTFLVTVNPGNVAPHVAQPLADLTVAANAAPVLDYANLNAVFDDADNADNELVYTITGNSPPGIVTATIKADDTLDLSFTPGASGVVSITVRATDPGLLFAEDTFQVTVGAPAIAETIGLYDPASGTLFLNTTNMPGPADLVFRYGPKGVDWIPLMGDWNSNDIDTAGLYVPETSTFHLRTTNTPGPGTLNFDFGTAGAGWLPVAGDWNRNGFDSPGLYDPSAGEFYLRYFSAGGRADLSFRFGPVDSGWLPLSGDWDGDGIDTVGLFDPAANRFFLLNRLAPGVADVTFRFGPRGAGWVPFSGDWDGDGRDSIGLYDPVSSTFFLTNRLEPGVADRVVRFGPKNAGWIPLAGDWDGPTSATASTTQAATPRWHSELEATKLSAPLSLEADRSSEPDTLASPAGGPGASGAFPLPTDSRLSLAAPADPAVGQSPRDREWPALGDHGSDSQTEAAIDAAILELLDEHAGLSPLAWAGVQ